MGSSDHGCSGCLPWGRQRVSSADIKKSSSARPLTSANSIKVRGILKSTPEAGPPKRRSQIGPSDNSNASINESPSDEGAAAYPTSATAFGRAEELPPTTNSSDSTQTRSPRANPQTGFASQSNAQLNPTDPWSSTSTSSPQDNYLIPQPGPMSSPLPKTDAILGSYGDTATGGGAAAAGVLPSATAAVAAAGRADTTSRLQDLQDRYRQRFTRRRGDPVSLATAAAAAEAVTATNKDDRLHRPDQMQCDSFTHNFIDYSRPSNNSGQMGPLPPLPASPARAISLGLGHIQSHVHGNGHGGSGGGSAAVAAGRQAHKRQGQARQEERQTSPLKALSPDLSRMSFMTTTHIPGSLPSMTQASPAATRIYPAAAATPSAGWEGAPPHGATLQSSRPSGSTMEASQSSAATAATPPTPSSPPAQSSHSTAAATAAVAARNGNVYGLQVDLEAYPVAAGSGGVDSDGAGLGRGKEGFTFSPHMSRVGGGGDGDAALRQSNGGAGTPLHRTTHGPAGYSSGVAAAAAAAAGSGGGGGGGGGDSSLLSTGPCAALGLNPNASLGRKYVKDGGGGGGGGGVGGGGGGRHSLPLYEGVPVGTALAEPPSLAAAREPQRTTSPDCITSSSTSPGHPPPPPQLQRSELGNSDLAISTAAATAAAAPSHLQAHTRSSLRLLQPQLQSQYLEDDDQRGGKPPSPSPSPPPPRRRLSEAPAAAARWAAFGDGLSSGGTVAAEAATAAAAAREGGGGGGGGRRLATRASQKRVEAARANGEMLAALLGSSKRALLEVDTKPRTPGSGFGVTAELERFDRVQDAMARLDGIFTSPSPLPAALAARPANARVSDTEDAVHDFAGAVPPAAANMMLGVKAW